LLGATLDLNPALGKWTSVNIILGSGSVRDERCDIEILMKIRMVKDTFSQRKLLLMAKYAFSKRKVVLTY